MELRENEDILKTFAFGGLQDGHAGFQRLKSERCSCCAVLCRKTEMT